MNHVPSPVRNILEHDFSLRGIPFDSVLQRVYDHLEADGYKVQVFSERDPVLWQVNRNLEKCMVEIEPVARAPSLISVRVIRDVVLERTMEGKSVHMPTKSKKQGSLGRRLFNGIWIFYILFVLLSQFSFFSQKISKPFADFLVWSLIILGSVYIGYYLWTHRKRSITGTKHELTVFEKITTYIRSIVQSESSTKKCWKCFKPLVPGSDYCPHCGAKL